MNTNTKLKEVYNDSEIIAGSGFTMKSNYILPLVSRMIDEGIINNSAGTVVQMVLQYKHDKENPFPSREELARVLGKSVSYVKKALKSIKDAGILAIEKSGRSNTYSFKPFFALLEKFIVEMKQNKNFDVLISDLLNIKIQKKEEKEEHDFSWSENYSSEKEIVAEEKEEVKDDSEKPEETEEIVLPEKLNTLLKANSVGKEGIEEVKNMYNAYKDRVHEDVFADKIIASVGKNNFSIYFNKCLNNAYRNSEQPKQVQTKSNYQKQGKEEVQPDWFEKDYSVKNTDEPKQKPKQLTEEEKIACASIVELDEIEQHYDIMLGAMPNSINALEKKELIAKKREELNSKVVKDA